MAKAEAEPKSTEQSTERFNPGKNGNALKVGNPGHIGGGGRPPNELRALAKVDWELGQKHIRAACEAGPGDTPAQNRRFEFAMDMAAKLGIGFKQENENTGSETVRIVFGKDKE